MLYAIYFIYGLCVMFYFMMSWLFYRKDKELLSRLVTVLMFVTGVQCLKDLFFIKPLVELDELNWMLATAADMVTVPLYAFVLIELCTAYRFSLSVFHYEFHFCGWRIVRCKVYFGKVVCAQQYFLRSVVVAKSASVH